MKKQHICLWTAGQPHLAEQCGSMANDLPELPDPVPLAQTVLIEYYWGRTKFDIFVTSCSLRTTAWGDEEVTWLHCKGMQTANVNSDGSYTLMMVLIPAHFVTSIQTGASYQIRTVRKSEDLGVFPPNQPTPRGVLPLADVQRVLLQLQTTERN